MLILLLNNLFKADVFNYSEMGVSIFVMSSFCFLLQQVSEFIVTILWAKVVTSSNSALVVVVFHYTPFPEAVNHNTVA